MWSQWNSIVDAHRQPYSAFEDTFTALEEKYPAWRFSVRLRVGYRYKLCKRTKRVYVSPKIAPLTHIDLQIISDEISHRIEQETANANN